MTLESYLCFTSDNFSRFNLGCDHGWAVISRQVPCCLVQRKGGQWSCFWTETGQAVRNANIDKNSNSSTSMLSYCTNASKAISTPPCRVVDLASRVPKDRRSPPRKNPVGPTSVPHLEEINCFLYKIYNGQFNHQVDQYPMWLWMSRSGANNHLFVCVLY